MFKKLTLAGALALGMLAVGSGPSLAGVDIDIGIGGGGGYGGGGRISCRQGARIVRSAGFRGVRAIDCYGREFSYRGFRRDRMFKIDVRSRNGRIVNIDRIGRGGGGGGYGDDYDDDEY